LRDKKTEISKNYPYERVIYMRIGVIADDLTGANDTGVKLSQKGIKTSVNFDMKDIDNLQSVVYDTDSRYMQKELAYKAVFQIACAYKDQGFTFIYKKMDSTIRGNVGTELDAVYDVFKPDFIIIAPGYPSSGRVIKDGQIYLHGKRLDFSEYGESPIDTECDYDLLHKIKKQSKYKVTLFTSHDLNETRIVSKMSESYKAGIPYLVFDSVNESDLQKIAFFVSQSQYKVIWSGSSGLINYLPAVYHLEKKVEKITPTIVGEIPSLTVIGSFNDVTMLQLKRVLKEKKIKGFKINFKPLLKNNDEKKSEIIRIVNEAIEHANCGYNILIYASSSIQEVQQALELGKVYGMDSTQVCSTIVQALGEIAKRITDKKQFKGIIMTGGDTAKQVCLHLEAKGIELIDEMSPIIPIGRLIGKKTMYTITKGGGIGNEESLVAAMKWIERESWEEVP
jgi:D-threonate/D-erythronate kinase